MMADLFSASPATHSAASERQSSAGPFQLGETTWVCWIVDGGQRYEWRSTCGKFAVWRDGRMFRARRNGRVSDREFSSLVVAMQAAAQSKSGAP